MKKLLLFVILTLSLVMPSLALAKVKVVATLPTLAAVAREMGGDEVTVDVLATTSQDPHFVDARPDYILKANKADLLIYNGMELEIGWLPPIQKSARNARIMDGAIGALDASTAIRALDIARTKVERSQGDIHAQGNPHYLYSLEEVILVSKAVSEKLSQLDPEHAALFRARYANFESRAQKKAAEAKARFAALPASKKAVVAYHDSMPYLLQWLGLTQLATIEPKPGIASQSFCLAAHSLGLGTVIMGLFDDTIADLIDLPEGQAISCIIALGYPAESPAAPKRKEVSDLVSYR